MMQRALYLPYRLAFDLVSIASRFINAVFFCGSTARAQMQAVTYHRQRGEIQRFKVGF